MTRKKFNTTGLCVPEKHYMADISAKLDAMMAMVEEGAYFVVNRPRQYGKTTLLSLLTQQLQARQDYIPILISFEGISSASNQDEPAFLHAVIDDIRQMFELMRYDSCLSVFHQSQEIVTLRQFGRWVTELVNTSQRRLVLMIDEVDKSSNYQLFIDFLALLRTKYLAAAGKRDVTFHSVILAGVHDVKSLKAKLRPDNEQKPFDAAQSKYNSPWNIAADFTLDLGLSREEIQPMLAEYRDATGVEMDVEQIAERLWHYTSGYPFLVSALCKILDEELKLSCWLPDHVDEAVNRLLGKSNTNFDHLIKSLQSQPEFATLIEQILLFEQPVSFNQDNPLIHAGVQYGILANHKGIVAIHNRIYQERIYNYLASTLETGELVSRSMEQYMFPARFVLADGTLDIAGVLLKFQEFMRQEYSQRDAQFLERHGRLVFFAFLRPILNGRGFAFKEPQISEEKRLDVVITFGAQKEIIELKRWRGEELHRQGLRQLADYLERTGHKRGALVIFDFSRTRERHWQQEHLEVNGKTIFAVWV